MARKDNKIEVQHYVPKMLLKNFSFKKKSKHPRVHVYDKHEGQTFSPNIGNIVAEKGFYDIKLGNLYTSFEPNLADLETKAHAVIEKLLAEKNLKILDNSDKSWLSIFIACQLLRTKAFREMIGGGQSQLREKLTRQHGDKAKEIDGLDFFEDETDLQNFTTIFMMKNLGEFAGLVGRKVWFLHETTGDTTFILGDSPVVMHNENKFDVYGNLGVAVPGIQIYMPLSPTLVFGIWCPSIVQEFSDNLEKAKKMMSEALALRATAKTSNYPEIDFFLKTLETSMTNISNTLSALELKTPLPASPDNVTFINSLQVKWANRYVLSVNADFSLVERMLKDSSNYKTGIKFKLN